VGMGEETCEDCRSWEEELYLTHFQCTHFSQILDAGFGYHLVSFLSYEPMGLGFQVFCLISYRGFVLGFQGFVCCFS